MVHIRPNKAKIGEEYVKLRIANSYGSELQNWTNHKWWSSTNLSLPFVVNGKTYRIVGGWIHKL